MSLVQLSGVSFSYGGPIDVFSNLDLQLDVGWTGIVGANGGGKTTLLRLIAGELRPEAGGVHVSPADAAVHLCHQRVDELAGNVRDFAASWDASAVRLRARLDLEPDQLQRWSTLSPGERKRWQIAAALERRPDVLLLDEPTNHLDAAARDRLVRALRRARGVGLLVSHDRALLDELTTRTVRVTPGGATLYRGGYSEAREQWEDERRRAAQAHATARARVKAVRRRLADARRNRASAAANMSTARRAKGPRDSDARSIAAKGRAAGGEAHHSHQVKLLRRATDRAAAEAAAISVERRRGRSLFVRYEPAPMSPIVRLDAEVVRAGDRPLLRDVSLTVNRGDRIHVRGANGSGKTTLLRAVIDAAGDRADRFLYLPQELPRVPRQQARAADEAVADLTDRTLEIVAALGVDPGRVLDSASLSPGELRKLVLAAGLARDAWALLLDEPTNHLDLPSIERLQVALADYPGAILLVSHDAPLAAALTDIAWCVGDGAVQVQ